MEELCRTVAERFGEADDNDIGTGASNRGRKEGAGETSLDGDCAEGRSGLG